MQTAFQLCQLAPHEALPTGGAGGDCQLEEGGAHVPSWSQASDTATVAGFHFSHNQNQPHWAPSEVPAPVAFGSLLRGLALWAPPMGSDNPNSSFCGQPLRIVAASNADHHSATSRVLFGLFS